MITKVLREKWKIFLLRNSFYTIEEFLHFEGF